MNIIAILVGCFIGSFITTYLFNRIKDKQNQLRLEYENIGIKKRRTLKFRSGKEVDEEQEELQSFILVHPASVYLRDEIAIDVMSEKTISSLYNPIEKEFGLIDDRFFMMDNEIALMDENLEVMFADVVQLQFPCSQRQEERAVLNAFFLRLIEAAITKQQDIEVFLSIEQEDLPACVIDGGFWTFSSDEPTEHIKTLVDIQQTIQSLAISIKFLLNLIIVEKAKTSSAQKLEEIRNDT